MPKIISANRLVDGTVVYRSPSGAWAEALDRAEFFTDDSSAQKGLTSARDDVTRNLVLDPFLVEVAAEAHGPRPARLRDRIRARGPTIDYAPRPHREIAPIAGE